MGFYVRIPGRCASITGFEQRRGTKDASTCRPVLSKTGKSTLYFRAVIFGAYIVLYSQAPEADRAFFADVLGFCSVRCRTWLADPHLAPAESAIHPTGIDFSPTHAREKLLGPVLYLMCDILKQRLRYLQGKNMRCTEIQEAPWGTSTTIPLPSGRAIGLYQPRQETALKLSSR